MPVISYTPTKNYPSFSGLINQLIVPSTYATAGPQTYTTADIMGGFILRDTGGVARSDVTPTAAQIIAGIEGAQVGSSVKFFIQNTSAGAFAITVTAGTGVTLSGTMTIAQSNIKEFLILVTALPSPVSGSGAAVTIYSLGSSVF